MYIDDNLNYRIIENSSNEAFQALWVETEFTDKANIICAVIYRRHNSPECFQSYFEDILEELSISKKLVYILGYFNINLLRFETCKYAHNFLVSLQSYGFSPTIDKPTRVYNNSATLIYNILIGNNSDFVISGNIVSDIGY